MDTGEPVHGVRHAIRLPDGERAYLSINAAPSFDERGQVDGMVASIEDVSERKRAEDALVVSERKHRNIIESIPLGMHVYRLEQDGRLVFVEANPAADKILGVDNRQFVGKAIEEAFPALVERGVPEQYRRVAETGEPWSVDQIYYDENRIVGAFGVHAFQTSPGRMVAAFIDVTERVEAEDEVRRWKRLLENVTDSMPSVLITLDLAGRVLTWNPAAEKTTGLSMEEVGGKLVWRVYPVLRRYRDLVDQVLETGKGAHQLKEPVGGQDGVSYRDVSIFPLVANGVDGVVVRIDDVTQRVRMEEMMLQSAKMASVGGLAAGVAHEINNPLGAMMQGAQILHLRLDTRRTMTRRRLEACGVDPAALERYIEQRGLLDYVDGIRQTGARAAKIVTDLLHFSRRSGSKIAPNDLNHLVRQVLDLAESDYDLEKKYDFRDVDLLWDPAADLPPVYCDGQQIQQVVLNLVRNAAQAMAELSKQDSAYEPQLRLRTLRRGDWGCLEVEDNGPGIPEEIRDQLFKPFFTTKTQEEGTGLGLWLGWSIVVERHNGRMRVERGESGGARFVIELKLA
jgi:PAS domain S-box-containing protein